MNEEAARREFHQLVKRINNLTQYIMTVTDSLMEIHDEIYLRMDMFTDANDYIKKEWTEIKLKFEEIFGTRYMWHKS